MKELFKTIEEDGHKVYKGLYGTDILLNEKFTVNIPLNKNYKIEFKRGYHIEQTKYGFVVLKDLFILKDNNTSVIIESFTDFLDKYVLNKVIKEEDIKEYVLEKLYEDVLLDDDLKESVVFDLNKKGIVFDGNDEYEKYIENNSKEIKKILFENFSESENYSYYEDEAFSIIEKRIEEIYKKSNLTININGKKTDLNTAVKTNIQNNRVFLSDYFKIKKSVKKLSRNNEKDGLMFYVKHGMSKASSLSFLLNNAFGSLQKHRLSYCEKDETEKNLAFLINELSEIILNEEDYIFAGSVLLETVSKFYDEKINFKNFKKYLTNDSFNLLTKALIFNFKFKEPLKSPFITLLLSEAIRKGKIKTGKEIPYIQAVFYRLKTKNNTEDYEIEETKESLLKYDFFANLSFYVNALEQIKESVSYISLTKEEFQEFFAELLSFRVAVKNFFDGDNEIKFFYTYDKNSITFERVSIPYNPDFIPYKIEQIDKQISNIFKEGLFIYVKKILEPDFFEIFYETARENKEEYAVEILNKWFKDSGIKVNRCNKNKKNTTKVFNKKVYQTNIKNLAKEIGQNRYDNKDVKKALAIYATKTDETNVFNKIPENNIVYYDKIFGSIKSLEMIKEEIEKIKNHENAIKHIKK